MSKICFVSYEIAPTTKGGAGALIANIARVLVNEGHQVVLLLDLPRSEYEQFQWQDRLDFQRCEAITAYHVEEISQDIPARRENFHTEFEWRSYRFYWALRKVSQLECPDIIEFFDYAGVGYYSIKAKIAGEAFSGSWLTIRVHTTIEAIDKHDPTTYDLEKHLVYSLERYALQIAEMVFLPSNNIYEHVIHPLYQEKWLGEIVQSPPPLIIFPHYQPNDDANGILFYGRLDQLKGADTFIDAAVMLLSQIDDPALRFILAGGDQNIVPNGYASYREYLSHRIPSDFIGYFEFTGSLAKNELETLLPHIQFAVFPNRLESYGYAAHELYAAGVPLILNDIPAFFDIFLDGENALFFNGSRTDLAQKMKTLYDDQDLRHRLRKPPQNIIDTTSEAYNMSKAKSWINKPEHIIFQQITKVIILDDHSDDIKVEFTASSFAEKKDIIILSAKPRSDNLSIQILGQLYYPHVWSGDSIPLTDLTTQDSLLILQAGDVVNPEFIGKANNILSCHPEIGFITSWRIVRKGNEQILDTFPIDTALDLLPFRANYFPTRIIMRTRPEQNLLDLFDSRLQQLGEINFLWRLANQHGPGVMLPEPLLQVNDDQVAIEWDSKIFNFLLMNAEPTIQKRLNPFLSSSYIDPTKRSYLEWAELDLRLLLKNLSQPPLGNLLRLKRNFSILFKRYLG